MNLDLSGKNALVGGSSRGIGKAAAIALAELGANVTLLARNAEALGEISLALPNTLEQKHDFIAADFSDPEDLKKKVKALLLKKPIHILINNTGGPKGGPITDAGTDEFTNAFRNHVVCNQILAGLVLPGMEKAGYGRIINVISTSVKQPIPGLGVSNTIRGAVASWAKTLAGEVGKHGVTVNNVLPGFTATERLAEIITFRANKQGKTEAEIKQGMEASVPMGRFADASEIANAIAFLSSPAAAYINGINVPVDGGRTKSL